MNSCFSTLHVPIKLGSSLQWIFLANMFLTYSSSNSGTLVLDDIFSTRYYLCTSFSSELLFAT